MNALFKDAVVWAAARAAEPSTWAGLAAGIGGITFLPHAREGADIASGMGLIVCALVAIARKERGSPS